jgi:CRISPR-associated protein Cas8a1/Csx13
MSAFTLSIFEPNTLLPHRAGIAGLALALSVMPPEDAPLTWEVKDNAVTLAWDGVSDRDAVTWLVQQTYQVTADGYLDVPALKLDNQGLYTFTEGVLSTFLQHSKQRSRDSNAVAKTFQIDEGQPEIRVEFRPLLSCYYTGDLKEAFNTKGVFKKEISLKGHHLPGLIECFVNGAYQESPTGFLALLFLPLACGYYKLPNLRSAVVIPEVQNLTQWVKHKQDFPGRTYRDFRSSGAGESALNFLWREKTLSDIGLAQVDYCEVYQLGKQTWDANQNYLKQAVYRVQVDESVLALYQSAQVLFPPQVKKTDKGETWLAISKVLPWICDNLVAGDVWYRGFYEFCKQNGFYERKGLVKMTDYLNAREQVLFDAVQGAFSAYLRGQIVQAEKQGRPLDYGQVTDKLLNRLKRPSTQQDFAQTLVDVLTQYRSKEMRAVGPQIYHWLHHDEANWRQARDLVLLAIATYTSKKGDALDGAEVPIESSSESEGYSDDLLAS